MQIIRLLAVLLLFAVPAAAQSATRNIVLKWVDGKNPAGTVYNVYKSIGACSGNPTTTQIASALAVLTYTDPEPPGTYCFAVTAVVGGVESPLSNTVGPSIPFTVTVTVQVL